MKIEELYEIYKKHPVVNTDTRTITSGQLFFALKGANFNGNSYASEALNKGAAFAIVDEAEYAVSDKHLLVDDVLGTLQALANFHRNQLDIPVLGITGSNGKTTTKELINAVLSKKYKTLATKGNLNNHIGVPLTLLSITNDIEFAIIEMGANKLKDIEELCAIAEPNFGLVTNIGKAHLEGFGSIEGTIKTKGELYDHVESKHGTVFINGRNAVLKERAKEVKDKIFYLGDASYYEASIVPSEYFLSLKTENGSILKTHLFGDYNFENIVAALCIGKYFKVDPSAAEEAISDYVPSNNRSQLMQLGSNTIIMDAYNANPSSMKAALENFIKASSKKKIVILGDMLELGHESEKEHLEISRLAHHESIAQTYLVGEQFTKYGEGEHKYPSKDSLISELNRTPLEEATILIKGSRGMKLEELKDYLSG